MCAWLTNTSPDDIVSLVTQLRRQELGDLPVSDDAIIGTSKLSQAPSKSSVSQDAAAEVALILRMESQLTAKEAAERLAMELKKELCLHSKAASPEIPAYSKESFRAYVGKLLKYTSPQMLLHLAHRIRNSITERPESAWPLRGG